MIGKKQMVFVGKETGLPVVVALDDMDRQPSGPEARLTWHRRIILVNYLSLLMGSVPEIS